MGCSYVSMHLFYFKAYDFDWFFYGMYVLLSYASPPPEPCLRSIPIQSALPNVRVSGALGKTECDKLSGAWIAAPAATKRVSIRPAHLSGGSFQPAPPLSAPVSGAAKSVSAELANIRAAAVRDQSSASAGSQDSDSNSDSDSDSDSEFYKRNRIKMSNARWHKGAANNVSRRYFGPSIKPSINASSVVDQMVGGAPVPCANVEPFCSVVERVADSYQITSAARSMASDRPMADPKLYRGNVLKSFTYDLDGALVMSNGPRELFGDELGSSGFVSKAACYPKSREDAAAHEPLSRPGVLLSSSGVPLINLECSASLVVSVNVTPSPKLVVPTKLRSMLRPNEEGFQRGFFACIGWLNITDAISCRVYIADCRSHPVDEADQPYWERFRDDLRCAIWRSLRDVANVTFGGNDAGASGPTIRQRTNNMRLENNVTDFLAQHPKATIKVEHPILFFRLLWLHALKLNICLSIAVVSHGHKYLPSQCSPEFSVVESPDELEVSHAQMKPALDAIEPFIDAAWTRVGWKLFVEAFVEAVQCPVRVGAGFGIYLQGAKHQHDSSDGSSSRLYAVPPADLLSGGRNGTTSWPFGLPFRWPTSLTRESPPGSSELAFTWKKSSGHATDIRVPISPPADDTWRYNGIVSDSGPVGAGASDALLIPVRASQVMVYHPSRQLHTDMFSTPLLDRLKKKDVDLRRQLEDIQRLNAWQQALSRQPQNQQVDLHSSKRFEAHFEYEITPAHPMGSLEASLSRTLFWWIQITAQSPSLQFYLGAEELVLHLQTKIRVLILICVGLVHACRMRWVALVQRNKIMFEVFFPMVYGTQNSFVHQ
jgi:hypothetical protein